jgi:D-ribulokinase
MVDVVIGVDLGTQGARAIAVTREGVPVASAREALPAPAGHLPAEGHEQDPELWWNAVTTCLRRLASSLPRGTAVSGMAVDSTSGTVLPVDGKGDPLCAALMYNDARSRDLVPDVRRAGADLEARLGFAFDASFALPKILWLARERPEVFARARWFIHAADFITGRLTGDHGISDSSNALKTGYDVLEGRWPAFIDRDLGIPREKLPRIVPPGTPVGRVHARGAASSGLPEGTPVLAGATDGTAAQIASGAVEPGAWNSSLGTTLVVKGITRTLVRDPQGRIYCHRHPDGWWMPGGASNTGAEWVEREFPGEDLQRLNARAVERLPTRIVRYPLARRGERFPFRHSDAEGFTLGRPTDPVDAFAAGLEGLALLERLAYETLIEIGAPVGERIHVTGGGSRSDVWLRVRASALGRTLLRPVVSETAMGAALIAASGVWFGTLSRAARAMVRVDVAVEPDGALQAAYADTYRQFVAELIRRGYLSSPAP